MSNEIDIQIRVPNQTKYLSLIGKIGENMAHELARFNGDRDSLAHHLNVVLTEATVNAIRHANASDPDKELLIRIRVVDRELSIKVYDNGVGFDLNCVPFPDNGKSPLEEQGRGIFIIRSLMDSVEYKKDKGCNVLEMKKKLG